MINQATVSSAVVPVTLADLMAKADVSQSDVASLHRHLFSDASLDRVQADALFDLERATLTRCDAWTTFFVEAITDHVVWGGSPDRAAR